MKVVTAACLLCVGLAGCVVIHTGGPREGSGGVAGSVSVPDTRLEAGGAGDSPACSPAPGERC
jgi:hypothetical protein